MKIFDCVMYSGEHELVDLRLRELRGFVHKTILVEGDRWFTGEPKEVSYKGGLDVGHHVVEHEASPKDRWVNENRQRDGFLAAALAHGAKDDDLVLISDGDEIPSHTGLSALYTWPFERYAAAALVIRNHYYWLNCRDFGQGHDVYMPKILAAKVGTLKHVGPQQILDNRLSLPCIQNGGWHFSFLWGAEAISKKLSLYPHSEYDTPYWNDVARIQRCIDHCEDVFERPEHTFRVVPIDSTFPTVLQKDPSPWAHLIKESA